VGFGIIILSVFYIFWMNVGILVSFFPLMMEIYLDCGNPGLSVMYCFDGDLGSVGRIVRFERKSASLARLSMRYADVLLSAVQNDYNCCVSESNDSGVLCSSPHRT
jgi:hypothetical protein